jgi:hypothetical protein
MTNQEQLKAEIEEILKDFALAIQVLTIDPEADGKVTDPTAALLTAFNNHVDRCAPENIWSDTISDAFYKVGLEHLIQSESYMGSRYFCETCQADATSECRALNAQLVAARQDLTKFIQSTIREFTANLKGETHE